LFGDRPAACPAENTAFVIGVMQFGAGCADTAAHEQKEICSNQHAESGGQEVDPKGMPIPPRNAEPKVRAGFMLTPESGVSSVIKIA